MSQRWLLRSTYVPMRSLIVMQAGIDASPLFGRPNSNPSSRRGTRSFRGQGWANAQDASWLVVRLLGRHARRRLLISLAAHRAAGYSLTL